jgi:hypothetical protein
MLNAELEVRYRPVTSYERAVVPLLRRLVDDGFGSSEYLDKFFDYEAEDDYVRNLAS